MTEYHIWIKAKVTARNLDSATTKLEALKQKIAPVAESTEVEMVGQPPKATEDASA